jgi:hypothetical protein
MITEKNYQRRKRVIKKISDIIEEDGGTISEVTKSQLTDWLYGDIEKEQIEDAIVVDLLKKNYKEEETGHGGIFTLN